MAVKLENLGYGLIRYSGKTYPIETLSWSTDNDRLSIGSIANPQEFIPDSPINNLIDATNTPFASAAAVDTLLLTARQAYFYRLSGSTGGTAITNSRGIPVTDASGTQGELVIDGLIGDGSYTLKINKTS